MEEVVLLKPMSEELCDGTLSGPEATSEKDAREVGEVRLQVRDERVDTDELRSDLWKWLANRGSGGE